MAIIQDKSMAFLLKAFMHECDTTKKEYVLYLIARRLSKECLE